MLVSRRRNSSHDVDSVVGMWLRASRAHKAGGRKWAVRFLCAGHYPEPGSQQRYPKFRQIATILVLEQWCGLKRDSYQGMPIGMPPRPVECAGFSRCAMTGKPGGKPFRIAALAALLKRCPIHFSR